MACPYERRGGQTATQAPVTQALLPVSFYRTAHGGADSRTAKSGCATPAPVTQALLPVSFYRTAHGGAASRTAKSGCATMAVPAMTGHGREKV
jgi:hypothetical protein